MGQVTVFSGPERRRRWSEEERLRILSDAFAPGACVAEVCRRHDISSALIYTWRRKLREAGERASSLSEALPAPVFAEAVVDEDAAATSTVEHPVMIIDLPRGKRLSIYPAASPALVAAALKALR
ncbi:IS66-like element accessory protein TnpA [Croceicoccus marinus]|uniref:Transposase n=1 Tax=Croceicoccus marinus TaxID=450378 RepID=A0A1Z1FFB1_9SPHN|nr:transposase [Croceicoccus marinus]ARU17262.1 transposase [Croceicoccus marinus]ARU17508.1 transposase [Croceicoccus marinus]ARU18201.1 transposase [Croceicoccus marinus]ARU18472.1 transposase [Croceicoccus marinus]ARU18489.1 transposase [Croceicoccus marinus]